MKNVATRVCCNVCCLTGDISVGWKGTRAGKISTYDCFFTTPGKIWKVHGKTLTGYEWRKVAKNSKTVTQLDGHDVIRKEISESVGTWREIE